MPRHALQPEGLAVPTPPYSSVIVSGDLVFVSGQVPYDADGKLVSEDFAEQVRQTFRNMGLCLAAAGCGFDDVVKVTAFLSSFDDFPVYNAIYRDFFAEPYPARSSVPVPLVGFDIEVEAIARAPA